MASERITTSRKHTKSTYSYAGSLALQKLSYYGWRSILVVVLYDQVSQSSINETFDVFLLISIGMSISYLIGGLIGDLLIGNRSTAIIGGALMLVGSIIFLINPVVHPFAPIAVFVLGCGLYQSNLKAMYARLYLHDKRLLDSGFLLLYFFINVGSFFGALVVGLIAYYYGIEFGFLLVSVTVALSVTMLVLTKKPSQIITELDSNRKIVIIKEHLKETGVVLALFALYCLAWKLTYYDISTHFWTIDFESSTMNRMWVDTLTLVFHLVIGIYLIVTWSKKHYDKITKLTISVIVTLLTFGMSYLLYNEGSITTSVLTVLALFTYTVAQLFIEPLIDSSIAKLINQRFLAIAYGSIGLIGFGISYVYSAIEDGLLSVMESTIIVGFVGLFLLSIMLVLKKYRSNKVPITQAKKT
jgi:POT family proton-dependent oligopeptide transporter